MNLILIRLNLPLTAVFVAVFASMLVSISFIMLWAKQYFNIDSPWPGMINFLLLTIILNIYK